MLNSQHRPQHHTEWPKIGTRREGSSTPGVESLDVAAAFETHGSFVYRCALHWGLGGADADDLVQEVFVVAHRRRDDFDPEGSLRAWLYGIARRVASRHHRGGRRRAALDEAIAREPPDAPRGPSRVIELREAAEQLSQFLDALPESQREAFVLCELEELSAREVGDALGVSPNTVSSRLRMARGEFKRLVRRLEAQHEGVEASLRRAGQGAASDDQRQRQWSLIAAGLPTLAPAGGATATATAAGTGWWLALKTFAATVLVGTVAIAVPTVVLGDASQSQSQARMDDQVRADAAPQVPEQAPAPVAPPPSQTTTTAAIAPDGAAAPETNRPGEAAVDAPSSRRARPPSPGTTSPRHSDEDELTAEVALIKQLKQANAAGNYEQALRHATFHVDRFPGGALVEVRERGRWEALCGLGRPAEALRAAKTSGLPSLIRAAEAGCLD